MTEYAYDPEFPFIVVGTSSGVAHARYRHRNDAESFGRGFCKVIDTTPKPKIPVDAQHITWGSGTTAYSRTSGGWVGWTHGEVISEERLLGMIWDHKVTVLVPKEES